MNSTTTHDRPRRQRWGALLITAFLAAAALISTGPGVAHAALTPETTIPVGGSPRSVAVSPDGTTAYVANSLGNSVSMIDTATNSIYGTTSVGISPSSVAVSPDGATVYVVNFGGEGSVSVFDTATNTVTGTVTVGAAPTSVAVSPDGTAAYVANGSGRSVSVIDTATNTVTGTVTVGTYPSSVAVSPDGSSVYVVNRNDDSVSVIDTATNTVTGTVTVGAEPTSVAVSPVGTKAYVANGVGRSVSVIDTATNTVTDTATVGNYPISVAVSPVGTTVYVANLIGNTVSVLREVAATYTVTFDSNGGVGTMVAQSANASTPLASGAFTRDGYTFTGWNTVADGTGTSYVDGADYAFTADATLYAQWAAIEYTISYDLAGGTAGSPVNPVTYTIESAPVTLTAPTRDGYTFTGWTGTGLTDPTVSVTIPTGSTGDQTFTATWEAATHTVMFDPNGGVGTMASQSANASAPLASGAFTREGYAFTGWNTVADGTGTSYVDGADYAFTADATLYAQWAAIEYTISYDLAGGTAGSPVNPVTYTIESAPVTLTAPTRDGYTFTGWTGTGLTDPTVSVTIPTGSTGNQTFTATWEVNPAATLVIAGPVTVTELDTNPFMVEAFDAHGVSLGDVTGEVTLTGANATGADVTFPLDYALAGQTTTRTLTATLDSDPSVTGTLDVQVVSAVTGITITAPETVMQGDTITVQVTATGATRPLGDATSYAVITSNVSTDVVDGAEVSFPTASPHTLTAALGDLTATHIIEVTPSVTVTPTPKPATPATPTTRTPQSGLPVTGAGLHGGVLVTAGLLLALGAALTFTTYRRRHR